MVRASSLSLSKVADLSTPILLQTCAMGKTIPKAKLELFRADGNGTRVKYFEIEMENVLIGMVKPHLDGDDSYLSETINLKYSKIKSNYGISASTQTAYRPRWGRP